MKSFELKFNTQLALSRESSLGHGTNRPFTALFNQLHPNVAPKRCVH